MSLKTSTKFISSVEGINSFFPVIVKAIGQLYHMIETIEQGRRRGLRSYVKNSLRSYAI